jgi:hypothetical protein
MDNSWQLLSQGHGNDGYGDDHRYSDFYHGGGYGYTNVDDEKKYAATGTGGELSCNQFYVGGYGHQYPNKISGCGDGEAYGESWTYGSGYGSGRSSDYYAAGYGAINKDELREDGHGDGGMYESEAISNEVFYYHTYNDFNAYGGQY